MIKQYAIFRNCEDAKLAIERSLFDKRGDCFVLEGIVSKVYGLRIVKINSGERVQFCGQEIVNLTGEEVSDDIGLQGARMAIVDPEREYTKNVIRKMNGVSLLVTNASPICAIIAVHYKTDEDGKTYADINCKNHCEYSTEEFTVASVNKPEALPKTFVGADESTRIQIQVLEEKINASIDLPEPDNGNS